MDQRAAAPFTCEHDLDALAGEEAHRRLIDRGRQHRLGAALKERNAALSCAFCREQCRPRGDGTARKARWAQAEHCGETLQEAGEPCSDRLRFAE